jgi:nitrogenase molybdenum-iron protein NifN
VPLVHGSQGCSTYIRRYVISHFREPVDIASSNFTESTAIFGGGDNLKKALDNLARQYRPEAIGIATTCLSETIGDDVRLYLDEYRKAATRAGGDIPVLIHASTPSYRGTHMEGYHAAVRATVETIAETGPANGSVTLIPGFLSCADLRYLKEILSAFGAPCTMLPDYSETLDGESWPRYQRLSAGGTPVAAVRATGRAAATIQLGASLADGGTAARFLEERFGVPAFTLGLPVGIRQTDRFFEVLSSITGKETPLEHAKERGRLVDAYIDGHMYVFGKRAVLYGEADFVAAMASFLDEIGMVPAICATGAAPGRFAAMVRTGVTHSRPEEMLVVEDTDFASMLDACETARPDIVIGSSKGYHIARNLGLPIVRVGFPIHARIGGQRVRHVGDRGAQALFDRIVNALLHAMQEGSRVGYSYI